MNDSTYAKANDLKKQQEDTQYAIDSYQKLMKSELRIKLEVNGCFSSILDYDDQEKLVSIVRESITRHIEVWTADLKRINAEYEKL